MKADALLSRLDRVRAAGPAGSWIARCPAHADKTPSMTVRELDDGTVLVHCFAGCDVGAILGAVGLEFDALFPERPRDGRPRAPLRRPFPAEAVLAAVAFEAQVVMISANDIAAGRQLTEGELARLRTAAIRLSQAKDLACG